MPTYDYKCRAKHTTEANRPYEDSVIRCVKCGLPAERQMSAPAFKVIGGTGAQRKPR